MKSCLSSSGPGFKFIYIFFSCYVCFLTFSELNVDDGRWLPYPHPVTVPRRLAPTCRCVYIWILLILFPMTRPPILFSPPLVLILVGEHMAWLDSRHPLFVLTRISTVSVIYLFIIIILFVGCFSSLSFFVVSFSFYLSRGY